MRIYFPRTSFVRFTLLAAAALVLAGCDFFSRKVDGEISVHTSPSENVKLVLVPAHLIAQKELLNLFSEELPAFEHERDLAISRHRALKGNHKPLEELSSELEKMRTAVNADAAYGHLKEAAVTEIREVKNSVTAKQETLAAIYSVQEVRSLWERILQRLPIPVTKTNAEGRFHVTVPDVHEWFLISEAVRGEQRLRWCVPLMGTGRGISTLVLSNENVMEESQFEAYFRKLAPVSAAKRIAAVDEPSIVKETLAWTAGQREELKLTLEDLRSRAQKEVLAKKAAEDASHMIADEEKRKADEIAKLEKQRMAALLALEMKRNFVAQSRLSDVGSKHERLVLKNRKALDNVTIKAFTDDGISFTSDGGAAHVLWADLPEAWVEKYRDPITAQAAAEKAAEAAAVLDEAEAAGHEVELTFVKELGGSNDNSPLRGSIVKVLRANHANGWKETGGKLVFVLGMGKASFEKGRVIKAHIYPTGRRTSDGKEGSLPLHVGTATQALQFAHEAGLGLSEIAKDEL